MIRRPRLSEIRGRIDRLLHARRRRRALAEIAAGAYPESILFVCYGNICRSPYAARALEAARRRLGAPAGRTDSAGFVGSGRPTPAAGLAVAAGREIDLSGHESKLLSPELVAGYDLVVVMEARQARALRRRNGGAHRIVVLGDLDPGPIDARDILDPWNKAEDAFERSYGRIDRCIDELVRAAAALPARSAAGAGSGGEATSLPRREAV